MLWILPTENDSLLIRGRIEKGVVVLEQDVFLPEGTEVSVVVRAASELVEKVESEADRRDERERMSEDEHQRMIAEIERIAALPIEGQRDPFSGADHDKVLYGKP